MEQLEKSGLVLEGGGMRGIYTAGVLDVFLENGIGFDGVIGVSAGVVHGCSYLSGQKGRSIRYYKRYCKDWRFMSIRNLLLTGDMVGEDKGGSEAGYKSQWNPAPYGKGSGVFRADAWSCGSES